MENITRTEKLITAQELAEFLSVSPKTVLSWSELGKIPCYKLVGTSQKSPVRFNLSEIKNWLNTCKKGPATEYNSPAETLTVGQGKGRL